MRSLNTGSHFTLYLMKNDMNKSVLKSLSKYIFSISSICPLHILNNLLFIYIVFFIYGICIGQIIVKKADLSISQSNFIYMALFIQAVTLSASQRLIMEKTNKTGKPQPPTLTYTYREVYKIHANSHTHSNTHTHPRALVTHTSFRS